MGSEESEYAKANHRGRVLPTPCADYLGEVLVAGRIAGTFQIRVISACVKRFRRKVPFLLPIQTDNNVLQSTETPREQFRESFARTNARCRQDCSGAPRRLRAA